MKDKIYDLCIIGSGMAGLSCAISSASEGLSVIVVDKETKLGGQASQALLIENLLGFPEGITGEELEKKAIEQCLKFGIEFIAPFVVEKVYHKNFQNFGILSSTNEEIIACSILIATGIDYIPFESPNIWEYLGHNVFYGPPTPQIKYSNENIVIVGGSNSAGMSAYYLSNCEGCKITIICRHNLADKMSEYLVNSLKSQSNITILENTIISKIENNNDNTCIVTNNNETINFSKMFLLIGGKPNTEFLKELVQLDNEGYIQTDKSLQTIEEGIFVAGDIRSGSVKRIQAAAGEGSMASSYIFNYLANRKVY